MGAAGGNNCSLRPVPRIRPVLDPVAKHIIIFLCPADAGGLHTHGRGEICGTQAHRLKPRAGRCDLFYMGNAGGRFDYHFERDPLGPPLGCFNRCYQRINGINIRSTAHFRDHDLVQAFASLLQQINHVAVPIRGVEPVDPDGQCFVAPLHIVDCVDDVGACAVLVRRCDAVFEIKVDHISGRAGHFLKQGRTGSRSKQLAAVGTCRWRRLDAKAHDRVSLGNNVTSRLLELVLNYTAGRKSDFAGAALCLV